jgi:hypothetical protein
MSDGIPGLVGNSVGEAAAFAAGLAIGPLLEPILQEIKNKTWSGIPDLPLEATVLAQGVAENKIDPGVAASEAKLSGVAQTPFNALVAVMRKAPAVAEALILIRRGQLSPNAFPTVLQRAGLETQWLAAYEALSKTGLEPWEQPLTPADLAVGLIRGNLNNFDAPSGPAFPQGLSTEGSTVPLDPVLDLSVIHEAAASGIDPDRMALLARNVGLPPGVIEGLNMLNRGIINEAAFGLLIAQSDARLAWGPFLLQLRRMLLTAHEYAELYLRGWIAQDAMYAGTKLHGLTEADSDLLVEVMGRPLAVHQVTTAIARGGTFGGFYEGVPEPYLSAIRESNIRPEWGNYAYANRYTLPGYFVIKAILQAGGLTVDEATLIFEQEGWPPDLAGKAAQALAPATTTGGKPKTLSAATVRQLYKSDTITEPEAITRLEQDGYTADDAALYLKAG